MKAVIKFLVGVFAAPLALGMALALVALGLRLLGRRKAAAVLIVSAVAVMWACSVPLIGDVFITPLETRYRPLDESSRAAAAATAIVVLGSSYSPLEGRPVTSALDPQGLARISEGVRLARLFPGARLVVSGGLGWEDGPPIAQGYARFAREMGIAEGRLLLLDTARDTAQEARAIAAVPDLRDFILVTSAYHMPRAMTLMRREGLSPIPAPTSHQAGPELTVKGVRAAVIPSAFGLRKTELAWHEYVGLAAIHMGLD